MTSGGKSEIKEQLLFVYCVKPRSPPLCLTNGGPGGRTTSQLSRIANTHNLISARPTGKQKQNKTKETENSLKGVRCGRQTVKSGSICCSSTVDSDGVPNTKQHKVQKTLVYGCTGDNKKCQCSMEVVKSWHHRPSAREGERKRGRASDWGGKEKQNQPNLKCADSLYRLRKASQRRQ